MRYLHSMVRIRDIEASMRFYCEGLGLKLVRRVDNEKGRFSLIFLSSRDDWESANPPSKMRGAPLVELTYNWPDENGFVEEYNSGRNFGHLAFECDNIYALCAHLQEMGIPINRPPRDGSMAFVRSPDGISIELLQKGEPLPQSEPWVSMSNQGNW